MIGFLDASAVVRLYLDENSSGELRSFFNSLKSTVISSITLVETISAIAKKLRMGELSGDTYQDIFTTFSRDWGKYKRIWLSRSILERAMYFPKLYNLKAGDSIQLACAESLQSTSNERIQFISFDDQLNSAAGKLGLTVWEPPKPDSSSQF